MLPLLIRTLGGQMQDHSCFTRLIWQIADLLRGPYRPPQYGRTMLPMTVLRRFDCVLAPTKGEVLEKYTRLTMANTITGKALDQILDQKVGQRFHNHSRLDFQMLKGDPDHIAQHLTEYIRGFSDTVCPIFEHFEFEAKIEKLREANLLYLVVSRFSAVDLHPERVPNGQMGLILEDLIRRFNELANETAGDHFTPREVIRLLVNLLFMDDGALRATPGTVRRLFGYGQDYNKGGCQCLSPLSAPSPAQHRPEDRGDGRAFSRGHPT